MDNYEPWHAIQTFSKGAVCMIVEYHRPTQLSEALSLLARDDPAGVPIGGGSAFDRYGGAPLAVIDLQALGLDMIEIKGNTLELGATLSLQALVNWIEAHQGIGLGALKNAILHEAAYNLRQVGSVAGALVAADGRSPFATVMLALDTVLSLEPGNEPVGLGELLPLREEKLKQRLITRLSLPTNLRLAYETVARSPADRPIVCVGMAIWPSGRTRLALGGFGAAPTLAFDGTEPDGAETAARSAYSQAQDAWASAEYRQEIAEVLAHRAIQSLVESQI
jgi:CO/xanthine dehydrogenase FAD-binding subunit